MDATQEDIKAESTVIMLSGTNTSCVVTSTEMSFGRSNYELARSNKADLRVYWIL
jgi:hypothetical protein